jgi:multiple sugar transport system substrate-binding protein
LQKFMMIGVLLVILSGCGQSSIIDEKLLVKGHEPERKEEIVVWHTYSEEETKIFDNELIPQFEREYPNIIVTSVRQPYSAQLKSTIISRASAGKIPDIVRMDIAWVPEFSTLHLLYPLSDFQDFEKVIKPLQSIVMQTNFYEGHYYGLPLNMNTKVAIYNRKRLLQAGLIDPPKTMDQLVDVAKKNKGILGLESIAPWSFLPYFYAFGGLLMDDNFRYTQGYLNSNESKLALQKMVDLFDQKILNPNLLTGKSILWESVLRGDMLMIDDGPWFYSILNNSKDNKYNLLETTEVAPFPGNSIVGGEDLVILKDTKHLDASWTFLKWMTTKDAQGRMLKTGLIPTNSEVIADVPNEIKANPYIMATIKALDHSFLRPPIAKWESIEGIFMGYLLQIFIKKISVENGLNNAAVEIDHLLESTK